MPPLPSTSIISDAPTPSAPRVLSHPEKRTLRPASDATDTACSIAP
jgi:hypothetical protein